MSDETTETTETTTDHPFVGTQQRQNNWNDCGCGCTEADPGDPVTITAATRDPGDPTHWSFTTDTGEEIGGYDIYGYQDDPEDDPT